MQDSRLSTFKFELSHGRPHGTDNRLITLEPFIKEDDTVGYVVKDVFYGTRNEIVNAFASTLKELMPDTEEEYLQTHTLPGYVKAYFGVARGERIDMRREEGGGFSFHGPMLSILIKKPHAHSARVELARVIRQKLRG